MAAYAPANGHCGLLFNQSHLPFHPIRVRLCLFCLHFFFFVRSLWVNILFIFIFSFVLPRRPNLTWSRIKYHVIHVWLFVRFIPTIRCQSILFPMSLSHVIRTQFIRSVSKWFSVNHRHERVRLLFVTVSKSGASTVRIECKMNWTTERFHADTLKQFFPWKWRTWTS